jgi:hypothetical protein
MQYAEETRTAVLGFTIVDSRSVTRWPCPHRPAIDLVVRPHFGRIPAKVRDISEYGIGLSCHVAMERGTSLLLRMKPDGRLVTARVIHATQVRDGWHVGCALAESLTVEEVVAYVTPEVDPAA